MPRLDINRKKETLYFLGGGESGETIRHVQQRYLSVWSGEPKLETLK
jgi:hypothetical protein